MPRLTQPFVSDVRRPRHGESGHLRPRGKRLPITSLWDEMASAAPVELDVDPQFYTPPTSASGWDGRPFADDDDEAVPGVVIRHVSAGSGAAGLYGDGSGMHVVDLGADRRTAAEWPAPPTPWHARRGLRAALLGVGLMLAALTWRSLDPSAAVASPGAAQIVESPEIDETARPMVAATPTVPAAVILPEVVESPSAVEATPAVAEAEEVEEVDEAPSSSATGPEADFDYRSARRYLDEQAGFLRQTCMRKAKDPQKRLRIHVKARPDGRAVVAVPGAGPEAADCVRKALSFPFDRSPHGGAFVYSIGARSSRLEPRPL